MIEIAKQQRDIAEVIADNTISGSKKALIHRDRHCCLCSTSYKGTSETVSPVYGDARGNYGECQGRIFKDISMALVR
ncbi:unnamed protein product [Lasius platythorax]|uniref:Uncharacterized protein n=1 Tax=Lasius platythorax TaxID=488582 RepID=A0AAV2P481_9HYME